jgi:toxin-antitoxin system PIN domain toxin
VLVDANILIYAFMTGSAAHQVATFWLESQLHGDAAVGLPWASLLAFLRIATNARLWPQAATFGEAWAQVEAWLSAPPAWLVPPGEGHQRVLASLIPSLTDANSVPDAHLAALAIEHGLILASADQGFARFPGLRWLNPLAGN